MVIKVGVAASAAAFMGVLVYGQAAQAPKNEDVLPALLAEVRGLRAAMEQMASAGPRVQLFTSRLQLQEARMNNMIRRLDEVRGGLATQQRLLENAQEEQRRFETSLASDPARPGREELPQLIARAKREVADRRAAVTRLTAEEAQLTQELAVEQGRWTEINQRLDELERALSKR
jgi:hypothetical protein